MLWFIDAMLVTGVGVVGATVCDAGLWDSSVVSVIVGVGCIASVLDVVGTSSD